MSTAPELSPAEAARVAAFDAASTPPEVVVEMERVDRAAAALAGLDGILWNSLSERIGTCDYYRSRAATALAAAAIAALPPSPAEEALRRLKDKLTGVAQAYSHDAQYEHDAGHTTALDLLGDLRAALASPAHAPQGEPCGVDPCDCDHPSHDQRAKTAAACRRFNQKLIDGAR